MCMWIEFLFSIQACGVRSSRNCFAKTRALSFSDENSASREPEILVDKWQFGIYILRQLHRLANLTLQGVLRIQNGAHRLVSFDCLLSRPLNLFEAVSFVPERLTLDGCQLAHFQSSIQFFFYPRRFASEKAIPVLSSILPPILIRIHLPDANEEFARSGLCDGLI